MEFYGVWYLSLEYRLLNPGMGALFLHLVNIKVQLFGVVRQLVESMFLIIMEITVLGPMHIHLLHQLQD